MGQLEWKGVRTIIDRPFASALAAPGWHVACALFVSIAFPLAIALGSTGFLLEEEEMIWASAAVLGINLPFAWGLELMARSVGRSLSPTGNVVKRELDVAWVRIALLTSEELTISLQRLGFVQRGVFGFRILAWIACAVVVLASLIGSILR